jgi:hypothetical protein
MIEEIVSQFHLIPEHRKLLFFSVLLKTLGDKYIPLLFITIISHSLAASPSFEYVGEQGSHYFFGYFFKNELLFIVCLFVLIRNADHISSAIDTAKSNAAKPAPRSPQQQQRQQQQRDEQLSQKTRLMNFIQLLCLKSNPEVVLKSLHFLLQSLEKNRSRNKAPTSEQESGRFVIL